MTFRADDLTPLLAPIGKTGLGFHQGRVLTWNQATAENTIAMAGSVLTNVPVLNGTEVPLLAPGNIVGMLRFKTSYFILGRIVIPGQSDVGTLPGLQQGKGASESFFEISTERQLKAFAQFQVPEWANQALVMCVANASVANGSGGSRFVYLAASVSGGWGGEMYTQISNGGYGHISAATQYLLGAESFDVAFNGEIPLGSTITVGALMRADSTVPATGATVASVHATAIFRKV